MQKNKDYKRNQVRGLEQEIDICRNTVIKSHDFRKFKNSLLFHLRSSNAFALSWSKSPYKSVRIHKQNAPVSRTESTMVKPDESKKITSLQKLDVICFKRASPSFSYRLRNTGTSKFPHFLMVVLEYWLRKTGTSTSLMYSRPTCPTQTRHNTLQTRVGHT